ncbi:LSU ribosomal protein L17P [Abditibacterium utsteinense]|uniref:50S ribosomal protein L17 n=1 Tax=Abditibacterium utsteinense TaxID=1960156 RepID=A0A2S8ST40_9BACT|nr:50S ribosomal protein L17 [Abditibacterium utsteinense]PQV63973.1 LSU ribosomal protein L17P [Abditibacterium utsteinense]
MRHKVGKRKLNKPTDQRMALLKNQVQALFMHERVITTEARAKEVRSMAEKLITRAKVDNVANRQLVERTIQKPPMPSESKAKFALRKRENPMAIRKSVTVKKWRDAPHPEREILEKLFTDIAPRYAGRAKDAPGGNGGYTRIVKMPPRRGDAAPLAVLLLVE